MLEVIGTYADGWLPTLGRLDLDHIDALNRTIDDAALAAGRSPSDVRRLVNISGEFSDSRRGLLVGPRRARSTKLRAGRFSATPVAVSFSKGLWRRSPAGRCSRTAATKLA
jgi:alkanesulfonate monooxygenase SsuD/methylene tetrahydromethanopterin reductase-like flavin-dependent oxidoreductase (luciferase family)